MAFALGFGGVCGVGLKRNGGPSRPRLSVGVGLEENGLGFVSSSGCR